MTQAGDKILVLEADEASRQQLLELLQSSGFEAEALEPNAEGLQAARQAGAALVLLDQRLAGIESRDIVPEWKNSEITRHIPIVLLISGGPEERSLALDLGADDAVSRPFDSKELLARVRVRLRVKRAADQMRERLKIAEEGQQIAHTAFEALAVTEKMTKDAFSLDRALKIGVTAAFIVAVIMAGIFFLYSRTAKKDQQLANAIIARLSGGALRPQSLVADARRLRGQVPAAAGVPAAQRDELQKQADQLKAKMETADTQELSDLQHELAETNARLKKVESEGTAAEGIIGADVPSVCLLHVAVGFREKDSGQRLRYAGINPQGEPIQDSDGNPVLTVGGRGPEVRVDVFGTGFLAGQNGRVITNRHVAQPWWKNDEMSSLTDRGFQPEIAAIRAYFPNDARAFHTEIEKISDDTDLAAMQVDLQGLVRPKLEVDTAKDAAKSGESIVLMGYATGLAAILARADDATAQQIITTSQGDVTQILDELAKRSLIHPLITQGHVGDVLPDKIVFDAQTTSGGSGGPLLNSGGKVIGITYAVLNGFGGSNFGIPVRFTAPLLGN
ncbi:MAG: trypsin-like peptidase domain-containing protein [Candidatus Acidiferrales bacterium]